MRRDETRSFAHSKRKNGAATKAAPDDAGGVWTWTALGADSKLTVDWLVGDHDVEAASAFTLDVAGQLASRVQRTTDSRKPYPQAVEGASGADADFDQS